MNSNDNSFSHARSVDIRLLAFDADDTLWDCQGHFNEVENNYCRMLAPYGNRTEISHHLFQTETANMPLLGYGCKAFTISLVENAIKVSNGTISEDQLLSVISLGKQLLNIPATPLEGVEKTLKTLHESGKYQMVVFTKGDNLDQENKYRRSGLSRYFDDCIVVSDKTPHEYQRLCRLFNTDIHHLCMVGNSLKSDILPVLRLGGYAVHVPYALQWQMEDTDEEHESPHLRSIGAFEQLTKILL